ncbi:MAG: hypothetical protein V1743_01110 [Nanoarchaeota archaeon]
MKQGEINMDVLVRNLRHSNDFQNRIDWALRVAEKVVLESAPLEKYLKSVKDEFYHSMTRWVEERYRSDEERGACRSESMLLAFYAAEYGREIYQLKVMELEDVQMKKASKT